MQNITNNSNLSPNFTGMLSAKIGSHTTKSAYCCTHGDAKFVRFLSTLTNDEMKRIQLSTSDFGTPKIIISGAIAPRLNIFERLFYGVKTIQSKILNSKYSGVSQELIYKIDKKEYDYVKNKYCFITRKQIQNFQENILKCTNSEDKEFIDKFLR